MQLRAQGVEAMDYYLLAFVLGLARHCYTDFRYYLLYDSTNAFLVAVGLGRALYLGVLEEAFQGALALGLVMLVIYFASRGGMGEGDVKLAAVLGLWLGVRQGLACLLLAFVSGALCGAFWLLFHGKHKQQIPFGPYLALSALISYCYGKDLLAWYQQFYF